ncbi:chemotaxis protein methyltransferase CheR [Enterobacter sp. BIGb0383]|uniref:CheR family methyltransferase n=1 Tax=unclassified Enterobacter TaxID=2608935 RepID=UPI000F4A1F04|nr:MULTISPECIES: CheR family methyltransferase [unclassified Enterobacter]ROP58326.1 chemotaxis protein methyltransferase CheR [Enterobacter sp. BIGb0383]ROS06786.1 chemotaxis protein methyltransferase CheR [Enterobacter sp. BIGb0359]
MSDDTYTHNNELTHRYAQCNLTEQELAKIITLIYQRAGIVITDKRQDMVYNRLAPRLRALGMNNFSQYLHFLESALKHDEWQQFINALTTNLTSFFREAYHFPILAEHASRRAGGYSVWCTAASTGEEPWSIAITLDEVLGQSVAGPRILATDIDTSVLEKARLGTYRLTDLNSVSGERRKKYFLRRAQAGGQEQVKVGSTLQNAVHFQQLNLVAPVWDIPAPFDAIFCRNVMIYFDKKNQSQILNRFAKLLKPGGLLFVGHSEHFSHMDSPFRLKGQSVYCLTEKKT